MMSEAAHQNAFMQALFRRDDSVRSMVKSFDDGIATYRNNGSANAARAMALMFPAVSALLGEADFSALARLHCLAHPPQRGDWSQYGGAFGNWLANTNPGGVLDSLPFLPDLARLDGALGRCQDATDATPDLSTLALLEQDPATLRMVLHPSVSVLDLNYDLLDLRQAVLAALPLTPPVQKAAFLMLAREHWRAQSLVVDEATVTFVRNCLAGTTLLHAHEAATAIDEQFDVSAWLTQAIAAHIILNIEPI
jgi:Putative DNA-binding domain